MKRSILSALILMACVEAHAMGGPVYVDTTCERMERVRASALLKSWFKQLCSGKETTDDKCKDLDAFITSVVKNNKNIEKACGTK